VRYKEDIIEEWLDDFERQVDYLFKRGNLTSIERDDLYEHYQDITLELDKLQERIERLQKRRGVVAKKIELE